MEFECTLTVNGTTHVFRGQSGVLGAQVAVENFLNISLNEKNAESKNAKNKKGKKE